MERASTKYDLMIIGPATRDINIDYTGAEDRCTGGAVTFCMASAYAANPLVMGAVKIASSDDDILRDIPVPAEQLALLPSARTTLMHNTYHTADRERRSALCMAQSDTIRPEEIPAQDCRMYHLAGLLYGDFGGELMDALSERGLLAADAQGFLRHNEDGRLCFHDWKDKQRYLPKLAFLKTDALEAEILTGYTDRVQAAKALLAMGTREVMISHNSEILLYDGSEMLTCPIRARSLVGRTGRGDTTTGAYLARRMAGDSRRQALLYATACVSLKMETPGAFRGTAGDVRQYMERFYGEYL